MKTALTCSYTLPNDCTHSMKCPDDRRCWSACWSCPAWPNSFRRIYFDTPASESPCRECRSNVAGKLRSIRSVNKPPDQSLLRKICQKSLKRLTFANRAGFAELIHRFDDAVDEEVVQFFVQRSRATFHESFVAVDIVQHDPESETLRVETKANLNIECSNR